MQRSVFLFVLFWTASVFCQVTWVSQTRLVDFDKYFRSILQEAIYEVEQRGWCNLKFNENITQTLDDHLYQWHVHGTVTYANGFLVSIQKLDITAVQQYINNRNASNVMTVFAGTQGVLHMRQAKIGFDVIVQINGEDTPQRYTGIYNYNDIQLNFVIEKNIESGEMTTSSNLLSLPGGSGNRMIYMPANNMTEALSRKYVPSSNWDGVRGWGSNVIAPIMLEIATTHNIDFPELCIGC
ncbi:uncharacterized protein ACR2FA_010783 [Aphomia sociella]